MIIYGLLLLSTLLSATFPSLCINNIIFDLDGVLVTQSFYRIAKEVGPISFVGFFNPFGNRLEESIFQLLNEIQPPNAEYMVLKTHRGNVLPSLMIEYLLGTKTNEQIQTLIKNKTPHLIYRYDSRRKVALVEAIIKFIFTPTQFVNTIIPVSEGVNLLIACKNAKNKDGTPKNRLFIITNWDSVSFGLLTQNPLFASFLDLCDDIVVSGIVHLVKPDPAIFVHAFKQFNIDPSKEITFYIDDHAENLRGAQSLNCLKLRPILCKDFNIKSVKKKLKQFNVL